MSKLKLYDASLPREQILKEREERFLSRSSKEKFYDLLHLIQVSVKLNGGKPLKQPQGKGIVINKPTV